MLADGFKDRLGFEIVDGIDVRQRITIEVGDDATGRPPRIANVGVTAGVVKRPVAVVLKQPIRADVGNVEVVESVVVKVTHGDAGAEAVFDQTGCASHVREFSITEIPEQTVNVLGLVAARFPAASLREMEIRPAVRVVIQHAATAAVKFVHTLARLLGTGTIEILKLNTGRFRVVAKRDR